jgi:transposase
VSLDIFVKANKVIQFGVKLQTLQEHVKAIDEGEAPLLAKKKSGRPAKLTDEQ